MSYDAHGVQLAYPRGRTYYLKDSGDFNNVSKKVEGRCEWSGTLIRDQTGRWIPPELPTWARGQAADPTSHAGKRASYCIQRLHEY